MSWSMYMGMIAYDEDKKEYRVLSEIKEMWHLKNLCDTRCMLRDELEPECLPKDAYSIIDTYKSYDYVGTYNHEDVDMRMLEPVSDYNYGQAYIIKGDSDAHDEYLSHLKNMGEVDYYERIKNKQTDYVVIVEPTWKSRGGHFYSIKTFRDLADKLRMEYNEVILKKDRMKRMTSSLKYQALNNKAKNNVLSEYSYIDDEENEVTANLEACLFTIGIMEYFDDYKLKCYAYVHGD